MLGHYLSVTARSFRRQRGFVLLNVVGLATGLAACLLIGVFVAGELRYDRFHQAADRIFRIVHVISINDREVQVPVAPGPMAAELVNGSPQVEAACRLYRQTQVVARGPHRFFETDVLFADPSFFDLFSVPVVAGQTAGALARPDAAVITTEAAWKYFGDASAVGESLEIGDDTYQVAAVVEDIGDRSHLGFDLVLPLTALGGGPWIELWSAHNVYTYVRMRQGAGEAELQRTLDDLVERELGPAFAASVGKSFSDVLAEGGRFGYFVQPLTSIHLHSDLRLELKPNGDARAVRALIAVALITLLIAGCTYVNLATARATERAQEIGVRKAVGAGKRDLVGQFLTETMVAVGLAGTAAIVAVAAILYLADWGQATDALRGLLLHPATPVAFLGGLLLVALLAGAYPALVLSSFSPGVMLKLRRGGHLGRVLRRLLVIVQFAVTTVLLVWAVIIQRQMHFIQNKDLGFEPENVAVVDGIDRLEERWPAFKQQVLGISGVVSAAAATSVPGRQAWEVYAYPERSTREEDLVMVALIEADADFADTLGLRLKEGERYSAAESETRSVVLVNEMVEERLPWPTAVGKQVTVAKKEGTVVGVIDNLHVESLHTTFQPVVVRPLNVRPRVMAVRIAEAANAAAIERLGEIWDRFVPDRPLQISFLDAEIRATYRTEQRMLSVVQGFSLVAIVLSCLGIVGLAAHSASRRRREIGIRRAIGATTTEITLGLTWDLVRWVVIAVVVAAPVAVFASQRWLERFAYRTEVPVWLLPAAGLTVCLLAVLAVTSQALKASFANPAASLKEI